MFYLIRIKCIKTCRTLYTPSPIMPHASIIESPCFNIYCTKKACSWEGYVQGLATIMHTKGSQYIALFYTLVPLVIHMFVVAHLILKCQHFTLFLHMSYAYNCCRSYISFTQLFAIINLLNTKPTV